MTNEVPQKNNASPIDETCYVANEKGLVLEMSDKAKNEYKFALSGYRFYSPNKSSISGTGSDDWYFLCKAGKKKGYLCFSDGAGGSCWFFTEISNDEYDKLSSITSRDAYEMYWIGMLRNNSNLKGERIYNLHPHSSSTVRSLLPKASRMGVFTDNRLQILNKQD